MARFSCSLLALVHRPALCTVALLPLLALPAAAQYSIKAIEIHGAAPYTDAEVLTVCGLQPGQKMTHDSLANAAQHLLDTGVFADTTVSLGGTGFTRTVFIALKPLPASSMALAGFANFVWWTPAELDAALRHQVPFYRGGIPAAGNLPDSVNAALTAMLSARGVHGTVINGPVQPTDQHPQLTWEFRLDDPSVRLASVNLTGAPPALTAAMDRAVKHATGSRYNEGLNRDPMNEPLGEPIADLLLEPLRNAGYSDAQLTSITRSVAPASAGYVVTYNAILVSGGPFHVAALTWQPTSIYAQDAFMRDAKLHTSDLASQQALLDTEQPIVNAYLHLGYIDAYVDPHAQEDAAVHTVSYALEVIPGEIYRLKSVTPLHLSAEAQKDFDAGWLLKPGMPYDPLYVAKFLTNNTALRKLAGYTSSFQAAADPQTHLVDLTIVFAYTGIRYQ
jgi:outer membrane protein insertion porin family